MKVRLELSDVDTQLRGLLNEASFEALGSLLQDVVRARGLAGMKHIDQRPRPPLTKSIHQDLRHCNRWHLTPLMRRARPLDDDAIVRSACPESTLPNPPAVDRA